MTLGVLEDAFVADFKGLLPTDGGTQQQPPHLYRKVVEMLPPTQRPPLEHLLVAGCTELAQSNPGVFLEGSDATAEERSSFAADYWQKASDRAKCALEGRSYAPSREEVEARHAGLLQKHTASDHAIAASDFADVFHPDAGLACSSPVGDLEPVDVADLRPSSTGTDYKGRVLWCETIGEAYKSVTGVMTVVIDTHGHACALALYNCASIAQGLAEVQAWMPKGTVLSVSEPYCRLGDEGGLVVRCDHPGRVGFHAAWPAVLALPADIQTAAPTPLDLKERGNGYFKKKEYELARRAYGQALAACTRSLQPIEPSLRVVLHSNLAAANLSVGFYLAAEHDAEAALAIDPTHVKSQFRLARALDERGAHSKALKIMQKVPGVKPVELDKIRMHSLHAQGDLLALEKTQAADIANYYSSKIKIKMCPGNDQKGRGLFLTQSVEEDEPLFVERYVL